VNLSELRDRVRSLTGIRLISLRSDENIDTVVNEAYQEIINLESWPFLTSEENVSVAAGASSFATPQGYSEVNSLSYSDQFNAQVRIRQTTLDQLDMLDQTSEGSPEMYARIDGTTFRFWPKPTTSVTFFLRGKLDVDNLSRDSDEPIFANQFHPVLAYRAASRILGEEGDDSGRSEFYQLEANTFFLRMQQYYIRSNDRGLIVMGSRARKRRPNAY
jgi:hypothetical protein